METEERDATSRASFKCPNCNKTFTDLEADQLFDMSTCEFRCTFCGSVVEEDLSALPKKDSRLMLARFNDQLQPLYDLLREVEEIKLAPEILEPEPVDIDTIKGVQKPQTKISIDGQWSGDATRNMGFAVEETRVDISIGNNENADNVAVRKDRPVWMTESTIIANDNESNDDLLEKVAQSSTQTQSLSRNKKEDDIMSVLLQHEKQTGRNNPATNSLKSLQNNSSESEDEIDEREIDNQEIPHVDHIMESESDDDSPVVIVAGNPYQIEDIDDTLIAQMTPQEKDNYIQIYQEHFSHMYD